MKPKAAARRSSSHELSRLAPLWNLLLAGLVLLAGMAGPALHAIIPLSGSDSSYINYGNTTPFRSVGAIYLGGGVIGSGTYLGAGWVLTAAHVVEGQAPGNLTFVINSKVISVIQVFVSPDYVPDETAGDIALLQLDTSDPGFSGLSGTGAVGLPLFEIPASQHASYIGTHVFIAGLGKKTANGPDNAGTRRAARSPVTAITAQQLDASGISPNFPGAFAPGDSGGAVMANVNGVYCLVAVISAVVDQNVPPSEMINLSAMVGPARTFIQTTTNSAIAFMDTAVPPFYESASAFTAAVSSLRLSGTEDFSSAVYPPADPGGYVNDPLAPGVNNGAMPMGTNPAAGLTLQSNTLGTAAGGVLSPRGTNGLYIYAPVPPVLTSNLLLLQHPTDSLDLFFNLPGKTINAVGINPGCLLPNGVNASAPVRIRVHGLSGLMGDFTLHNVSVSNDASFVGFVAPAGETITRINLSTIAPDGYLSVDNIAVFSVAGGLEAGFDPNVNGNVEAVAMQPDGKLVIGGVFTTVGGQTRANIARLNADGSLDTTFNPGTGVNGDVHCVAVQPDGKILLGGFFTSVNGQTRNRIARLLADGSVESNATFNVGSGANSTILGLAVQADGKIVIGGNFSSVGGQSRNRIARLNSNGSVESTTTFNAGTGADGQIESLALQADGKIVIAGRFSSVNGTALIRIARLNTNGSVDGSFTPGAGANNIVNTVAVQADGKILLGGFFTNVGGTALNRIARLDANGTVDATFAIGNGADNPIESIAVQTDGKILLGGSFFNVNGQTRTRIARLYANGSVDSTFTPPGGASATVRGVALQADGNILVCGDFTSVNGTTRNHFARLDNQPATQTLAITNRQRVEWMRGGAGPEVEAVTFEVSTDGGITFSPFGSGTRISGGWERTGLAFPDNGRLRARGRTAGGFHNGSSGLVESLVPFVVAPEIFVADQSTPATELPDGGSRNLGALSLGTTTSINLVIRNTGNDNLLLTGVPKVQLDGSSASEFAVASQPSSPIAPGASALFTVQFAPVSSGLKSAAFHISNNDADEGTFDFTFTATAAAGSVDAGFVASTIQGLVAATAVQPDGKIVVVDDYQTVNTERRGRITRLLPDGSPDSAGSFHPGDDADNYILCATVQADGKIVIAGKFTTVGGQARKGIARLNADGSLESITTFNPGSGIKTDEGESVQTMSVQADGKILIGGTFTQVDGQPRKGVARLESNGSLDTTFNPGTGTDGDVFCLALQADGRIIVGGYFQNFAGQPRGSIARLSSSGSLESLATFHPAVGSDPFISCAAVQPDGRIVIGGTTDSAISPQPFIARLNGDGTSESTATFHPGSVEGEFVGSVALQADGKIIIGGGFAAVGGQSRNGIARLLADGSVEDGLTFNTGGGANDYVYCVGVQADGKILLGGAFTSVGGAARGGIARLTNDPATQSLTVPSGTRVQWLRGGTSPEVEPVTFELSINAGASWTPLGTGTRIAGGWEKTGMSLPPTGSIRARGNTSEGFGSSGLVETITSFTLPTPVQTWRQLHFGTMANSGTSADAADFDLDGIANVSEFGFGTDPASGTGAVLIFTGNTLTQHGQPYLSGSFPNFSAVFLRRLDRVAAGLTYTVEFSGNLSDWEVSAAIPTVVASDSEMEAVSLPFPALLISGLIPQFFRVIVSIAP